MGSGEWGEVGVERGRGGSVLEEGGDGGAVTSK